MTGGDLPVNHDPIWWMDTAAVKIKMRPMKWDSQHLGNGQSVTVQKRRVLQHIQIGVTMRALDTTTFTYLPVPLARTLSEDRVQGDEKGEFAFGLEPVLTGSQDGAIISYRRLITLRIWADAHLGKDEMRVTTSDAFAFRSETARTMFATFWNGVRVDQCTLDQMQEYRKRDD